MIIGFDASRAFVSSKTGTENYSYQLLIHLLKIDHQNQYIVYIRPNSQVTAQFPSNFSFKTINFPRLWTQVGIAVKTFIDPIDLLFVPAHTLPLIRRPGLKTIVTVHDLGSEYLPKSHKLKQRIYLSFMQKYQLKTASKIIAVSEATKKDLINKLGIESKKITMIYEGYDKKIFRLIKSNILVNTLSQYDIEAQSYFLFVGTVQPRKNLARVIQAFTKFKNSNLKLVIAGSKGWLSNEIYQLPEKLDIADKVKFLGYITDKELPSLYSGALALLFPSLFEGFGLPILEAQACGCPVITSGISSMPEVTGKGAILVDPYDIDDIVKGMERVKRKGERVKLINLGFENVRRFSWEKCARETLAVLEQIL